MWLRGLSAHQMSKKQNVTATPDVVVTETTTDVVTEYAKVRFTFSPIGAYGLSYFIGDEAELPTGLADLIVTNGHGEYVTSNNALEAAKLADDEQK